MSWIEFWDGKPPIYANARHEAAHYRQIAEDIVANLPGPGCHVLDYGCGAALSADRVADACAQLTLCDASANVRQALTAHFGKRSDIGILAPEQIAAALPDRSLDLIVANSVIQYLPAEDLRKALILWRTKLADGGRLLIADVVPPGQSPVADAAALLKFAAANGFFLAACTGLVKTYFSDYRKLRSSLGFQVFDERDMIALLSAGGFAARRHFPNLGHNSDRMAFMAMHAAPTVTIGAVSTLNGAFAQQNRSAQEG
ncbi:MULTISPECIES: class I SAM-dependent methyltransferase [Rhodomicrobium]|uniref:class I SAM-dependent methyltransferase n=1 Tax=Rhodomicrobium TaxID=1068 RepID=UPI000B4B4E44|nr:MULTISPECIES: class I SAM-dependent methyltransferase [Rhodomicrobium]